MSGPIRIDNRRLTVDRLQRTAHGLRLAIDASDDEDKVRAALAARGVFWKHVSPPNGSGARNVVEAVRRGSGLAVTTGGLLVADAAKTRATPIKSTRAYGGHRA